MLTFTYNLTARGTSNNASVQGGPELLKLSPFLSPDKDHSHRQLATAPPAASQLLETGQQSPFVLGT